MGEREEGAGGQAVAQMAVTLPWGLRKRRFKRVRTAAHGNKGQRWLAAEMTFH